jgi:hypothetical protein
VVAQLTLPAVLVHEYQLPAGASWIFTEVAVVGAIVKETESTFDGVAAFKLYATELTV